MRKGFFCKIAWFFGLFWPGSSAFPVLAAAEGEKALPQVVEASEDHMPASMATLSRRVTEAPFSSQATKGCAAL